MVHWKSKPSVSVGEPEGLAMDGGGGGGVGSRILFLEGSLTAASRATGISAGYTISSEPHRTYLVTV